MLLWLLFALAQAVLGVVDLAVRDASCPVCHCLCDGEDDSKGVGARLRVNILGNTRCSERFEHEHICKDPGDGELFLRRAMSGETQMEAGSDTDVQIVRHTWV